MWKFSRSRLVLVLAFGIARKERQILMFPCITCWRILTIWIRPRNMTICFLLVWNKALFHHAACLAVLLRHKSQAKLQGVTRLAIIKSCNNNQVLLFATIAFFSHSTVWHPSCNLPCNISVAQPVKTRYLKINPSHVAGNVAQCNVSDQATPIEFFNNGDAILNFEHISMHCGLSRVI